MNNNHESRPNSAIDSWKQTVIAEHAQADAFRSDTPGGDHWNKLAHRFAPVDRESAFEDETLKAVLKYVRPSDTVLDVGAGAGRLAVPLAERCKHVTAVEPSPAMRERMAEQAKAWGVDNLTIIGSSWEDATVEPADMVICSHVLYTVRDIGEFLRKLVSAAKREVVLVVFEESAMANYFPLWEQVYGEKRIPLPTLPEVKNVLTEMGLKFSMEKLPEWQSRPFPDEESAYEESMARLFMSPDSKYALNLKAALERSLVRTDDGLRFNWAEPHRPWLVRWNT
ncbi:MAG: class I SAM-dependent methyltransferase [Chloroflexi bacterium]|nr:class I SAM-dependent methyltransferase [Chloroflexota bacterium]